MGVLTKVRVPVSDIAKLSSGTTMIDITSSGGPIDIDVAGLEIVDILNTGVTVDAAKILTAKQITGETVLLSTTAGASASVATGATKLQVKTTSAHVLELLANSVLGLTVGTDGKLTLGVQGTSGTHLVNKTYVDTAAASASATVATIADPGTISIPNSTGNNLVIKWGVTNGSAGIQLTQVTFATAFPNAIFVALVVPQHNVLASSDGWWGVYNKTTAGFQINQANHLAGTLPYNWVCIGY